MKSIQRSDQVSAAPLKGSVVKDCTQRDTRTQKNGGLIEQDMDLALSVVTSIDQWWWLQQKIRCYMIRLYPLETQGIFREWSIQCHI